MVNKNLLHRHAKKYCYKFLLRSNDISLEKRKQLWLLLTDTVAN